MASGSAGQGHTEPFVLSIAHGAEVWVAKKVEGLLREASLEASCRLHISPERLANPHGRSKAGQGGGGSGGSNGGSGRGRRSSGGRSSSSRGRGKGKRSAPTELEGAAAAKRGRR